MAEIVNSVKVDISDRMLKALQDALGNDTGIIKKGPLHASPVKTVQAITLRDMDPSSLSSGWIDRRYATVPTDKRRFKMADDEIGGNQAWLLRGVAHLQFNFARSKKAREEALVEAEYYKAQTQDIINVMPDVFSSTDGRWSVMDIVVDHVDVKEQGGDKSWIWTYFVFWEASAYYNPYRSKYYGSDLD